MKILFIVPRIPFPLNDGFNLHVYYLCKNLKNLGNTLYLACPKSEKKKTSSLKNIYPKIFSKIFFIENYRFSYIEKIREYLYKITHIKYFSSKKKLYICSQLLERYFKKTNFDIIHYTSRLQDLFGLPLGQIHKYPKIIDFLDSHVLNLKRELITSKFSFLGFLKFFYLFFYHKKIETLITKTWKFISLVSQNDKKEFLKKSSKSKIYVIPNGIDINFFKQLEHHSIKKESPLILFHGSMNYYPNIKSVEYIIKKLFPLIKKHVKNVKLYIVGKNPPSYLKKFEKNNEIHFTGYVKNIYEYLLKADIILEPIVCGSGFKNKILEAMAVGKPVVTNSIGAEGLSEAAKKAIFISNSKDEIIQDVIKLLNNRKLRISMGQKAKEIAFKNHSWQKIAKIYLKLYRMVINNK
ncbi:MAG: glycosyltransferase family 4 protein [Promethearchaeota archaeon]